MISDCKLVTDDGIEIMIDKVISITVNNETYLIEDISWDEIEEEVRKDVEERHKAPVANTRQQKKAFNWLKRQKEELENDYVEGTSRYESIQRGRSEESVGEIQGESN